MKYYVYQLIDPRSNRPFYIGKGTKKRAWTHLSFKDGNNNLHKDRFIKNLKSLNLEPIVEIIQYFKCEIEAYDFEEKLIEAIGLDNLTNLVIGAKPPSKKGWKPSQSNLEKRSLKLKGIPRTEEWRKKLSLSKLGEKNGNFGKKIPCQESRRLAIIKTKNQAFIEIFKKAIELMDAGKSADTVSKELRIGRTVCFKLKNRKHNVFLAFPELG